MLYIFTFQESIYTTNFGGQLHLVFFVFISRVLPRMDLFDIDLLQLSPLLLPVAFVSCLSTC